MITSQLPILPHCPHTSEPNHATFSRTGM